MSDKIENPPAFPCEYDYINSSRSHANGMTLRDYFAAKAIHGAYDVSSCEWEHVAKNAYGIADAMLKARAK